jgi:hypothetical protein
MRRLYLIAYAGNVALDAESLTAFAERGVPITLHAIAALGCGDRTPDGTVVALP